MVENQKRNPAGGESSPFTSNRFTMRQVENVLYEHAGIEEVAAFFVSEEEQQEEKLIAFVVLRDSSITEEQLMDFLKQSPELEPGYTPSAIRIVPRIPKSPSGKVLKLRLLEDVLIK